MEADAHEDEPLQVDVYGIRVRASFPRQDYDALETWREVWNSSVVNFEGRPHLLGRPAAYIRSPGALSYK